MHNLAIIIPLIILLVLFFIYSPKLKVHLNYRKGNIHEGAVFRDLGFTSYSVYKNILAPLHWETLKNNLLNEDMWINLLETSVPFVCENNNTVVGMAFLVPSGHPTDIYPTDSSYIRMVGIHPDYAGKGIAKKLTQMCIDEARQNGEKVIKLHTSEFMDAARHIYTNLGFTIEKQIPDRFGKKYWLYALNL
ncbi:MAG: GNAT family N-acetyltransferase [Bacteroidia bacterium]